MQNLILISAIGVSILTIIYTLVLSRLVSKKPAGSKKMADVAKIIADEQKTASKKKYQNLAIAVIVIFTGSLYAFGFSASLCFLAGSIIFAAADYFAQLISNNTDVRMAEVSRSGIYQSFSLGFSASTAGSLLVSSVSLLAASVVFWLAGSSLALWGLALATIVVAVFSRQKNSSGYFAIYTTSLVAALVLASHYFPEAKNAQVFPLAIFAIGLLSTIIGSWLVRLGKKNFNLSVITTICLSATLLVFLTGSYFATRYLLPNPSKYSTVLLFLLMVAATLIAFGSLIFGRKIVVLPAICLAVIALMTNFFLGGYGIMLSIVGVAAFISTADAFNQLFASAKNAEIISQSAELPDEAKNNITTISVSKISSKNYAALSAGIIALAILLIFVNKFSAGAFAISNLKLTAGFLLGGALAYYFSSETKLDDLITLAMAIILPPLAGLIFGPSILAGLLAGVILTNLLVKNINRQVLALGLAAIFSAEFMTDLFDLKIQLIILGTLIVVIAAYSIIKTLYHGRRLENEK